jgi:nucleoid-associated protein YgaU
MPDIQPKKNILSQAIDLVSSRDEKAAAAEAVKRAEEAEKAAVAAKADAAKSAAEKDAAQKAAEEARKRATEAELKLREMERQQYFRDMAAKGMTPGGAQKAIAEHKVVSGDTLGGIALKYYGNAGKPYWMEIYAANKEVIGDNPNLIKPGQVLKILELPDNLKKK